MAGKGEIIFLTCCYKRNLENIIDTHNKELIIKINALQDALSIWHPETEEQYNNYCETFAQYTAMKSELKENGYGEFIFNHGNYTPSSRLKKKIKEQKAEQIRIQEITTRRKIKEFKQKHKYNHKQPKFKPQKKVSIKELLNENTELIQRLSTFDENNSKQAFKDFARYKIVQQMLSINLEKYATFNLHPSTASRILLLLGNRCSECGSQYKLTLHHTKYEEGTKRNNILNLKLLCKRCHRMKHGSQFAYEIYAQIKDQLGQFNLFTDEEKEDLT